MYDTEWLNERPLIITESNELRMELFIILYNYL